MDIVGSIAHFFPAGKLVREVEPSETDPELRGLEITNEVISILEEALNEHLSDEQKCQFLPAFKDKITRPIEKSLKDYDRKLHDQNLALEWENNHLRNKREIPPSALDEYLYREGAWSAGELVSLPYKFLRTTSDAPRGETLLGIRDDLERKLESYHDFMESNVWKRVQTDLSELQAALNTVQSRETFQANEIGRLREQIEELENRDYELLIQQQQMDISELENACDTLEVSLQRNTNYDVCSLMFSDAGRPDPDEDQVVAYRRIDLAFLALVNYTDDCSRCEDAINASEKPRGHFESLFEQAEHTRTEAGKLLEQARDSPETEIARELTETVRLYLARIHKIKMQMLRDGIEPPGYAASLRKRAGIDHLPRVMASARNKGESRPLHNESSPSSSWVQIRYNLPAKTSYNTPIASLFETAGSNQPPQAEPEVIAPSTYDAAHYKHYSQMFRDLELNLKEFIVEQHQRKEEEGDFSDLNSRGPIDVFKQAEKYGEFLGDEIRETRNSQGVEYELLLKAVDDNLLEFLTNDFRQDELAGARHCEKVIRELDDSLQTFLSNQIHLRDMENDLKVYMTNPDRQVKNIILIEQCNKMFKDLDASIKEFLHDQNIPRSVNATRLPTGEGTGVEVESQTETQSANETKVETLIGVQPKAAAAHHIQVADASKNNFDVRNYHFTIHAHRVPLWLLTLLALVAVLFSSYLANRSALEDVVRQGWVEANSFSRVVYKASWDDRSFYRVFPDEYLLMYLWLGIIPMSIWAIKETGLLAIVRNRMA